MKRIFLSLFVISLLFKPVYAENYMAKLKEAYDAEETGDYDKSLEIYNYLLDKGYDNPNIKLRYSRVCFKMEKTDKVINILEPVFKSINYKNPEYFPIGELLGLAYLQEVDIESAEKIFEKLVQSNGNNAWSYYYKGITGYIKGDPDMTLSNLKKASELNRKDPEIHFKVGEIYYYLGLLKNAEYNYCKAILNVEKLLNFHIDERYKTKLILLKVDVLKSLSWVYYRYYINADLEDTDMKQNLKEKIHSLMDEILKISPNNYEAKILRKYFVNAF